MIVLPSLYYEPKYKRTIDKFAGIGLCQDDLANLDIDAHDVDGKINASFLQNFKMADPTKMFKSNIDSYAEAVSTSWGRQFFLIVNVPFLGTFTHKFVDVNGKHHPIRLIENDKMWMSNIAYAPYQPLLHIEVEDGYNSYLQANGCYALVKAFIYDVIKNSRKEVTSGTIVRAARGELDVSDYEKYIVVGIYANGKKHAYFKCDPLGIFYDPLFGRHPRFDRTDKYIQPRIQADLYAEYIKGSKVSKDEDVVRSSGKVANTKDQKASGNNSFARKKTRSVEEVRNDSGTLVSWGFDD